MHHEIKSQLKVPASGLYLLSDCEHKDHSLNLGTVKHNQCSRAFKKDELSELYAHEERNLGCNIALTDAYLGSIQ